MMMRELRILVVDDDPTMLRLCLAILQRQGWRVECAADRKRAEEALGRTTYDLVVLDLNLPDGDGLDIGHRLRQQAIPFLLMTARSEPDDRLAGFEVGAADYLTKPFHPHELLHRIKRVLGRWPAAPLPPGNHHRIGPWFFDLDRRLLSNPDGRSIGLTLGELKLLATLVAARGRVVEREQLLEAVARGEGTGHYRTVDVLISRLRKKLEEDPGNPTLIVTATGMGYRLAVEQS